MALRRASPALLLRRKAVPSRSLARPFSLTTRRRDPDNDGPALSVTGPQDCALTGTSLLRSPYFNKGSAFTRDERVAFALEGLLPPNVQTLDEQVARAYAQFRTRDTSLAQNTFLASLRAQNEVLYYALVQAHIKEMFPVIYTPTQGDAIARFSHLFRRPEGCFLNIDDPAGIDGALGKWGRPEDIDLIVVTDGEAILGIGDQGVGGILISAAKLSVYTLCAGIHPHRVLPVVLDVGTNNEELLRDELYLGLKRGRVRGERYDAFVASFVRSARAHFPRALLHFEDFGRANAARLLDLYRGEFATFNDDIQGTGCTALAAIMSAARVAHLPLHDLRIVCFGAGSAGMGNASQIASAMAIEGGISLADARKNFWCIDRTGLLTTATPAEELTPAQRAFARPADEAGLPRADASLEEIIQRVKPHVLIGCSGVGGSFSEGAVRAMAAHADRPIILPLSNPTRLAEAEPADLYSWTDGRALVATGTAFPPVRWAGRAHAVAQCNNSVVFPGVGLGVVLCRARLLSDEMLVAATRAVAGWAPAVAGAEGEPQASGKTSETAGDRASETEGDRASETAGEKGINDDTALLPDVTQVRSVSVAVAKAVVRAAIEQGLHQVHGIPHDDDAALDAWVRRQMWDAAYRPLRRVALDEADRHARGAAGAQGGSAAAAE